MDHLLPAYVIYFFNNYIWIIVVIDIILAEMHKLQINMYLFVELEQLVNRLHNNMKLLCVILPIPILMMRQFVYDLLQVLLNVVFATLLHVTEQIVNNILHSLFVVSRKVHIVHRNFIDILVILFDYTKDKHIFF